MKIHTTLALILLLGSSLGACQCDPRTGTSTRPDAGPGAGGPAKKPSGQDAVREVEPNDDPQKASTYHQRTEAPGSPILLPFTGELDSAKDVDYVKLPATEAAVRILRVEADKGDLELLWGKEDAVTNSRGEGQGEEVPNLSPAEVIIGIRARAAAFPVTYRLSFEGRPSSHVTDIEPPPADAAPVELPGDIQGIVNYSGDVDAYQLQPKGLGETGAARVEMRIGEGCKLRVELSSGSGDVLLTRTVVSPAEPGAVTLMPNLRLPTDRELTLSVQPDGDAGCGEPYSVRLVAPPPGPEGRVLQLEPDSAEAPLVLTESATVAAFLHDTDDHDFFRIDGPEQAENKDEETGPTVLRMVLAKNATSLDIQVPSRWDEEKAKKQLLMPGDEPKIVLCNRPIDGQQTPVEVSFDGAEFDSNLPTTPIPYELVVEVRKADGEEVEPNGGRGTANALSLDTPVKGYVFPPKDVDVYRFELEDTGTASKPSRPDGGLGLADLAPRLLDQDAGSGEKTVTIDVEDVVWDLVLEVLDSEGAAIAKADKGGVGEPESLVVELPADKYFVRVSGKEEAPACEGPYTLRVAVKQ